jgi:DNA-3-methyladenine glycosylase II
MELKIVSHFQTTDLILFGLTQMYPPVSLKRAADPFFSLTESIISQQLSVKAGDTIVNRFLKLFPEKKITPAAVITIPRETMRGVGMSWSKADYIHNIARAVINGDIDFAHLDILNNEDLIGKLTQIKGIGQWTAEMFLMFSLGREDVFSVGDVGLQRAIQKLYKFKKKPTPKQLLRISSKWSPYRTYACRLLWNSLDQA